MTKEITVNTRNGVSAYRFRAMYALTKLSKQAGGFSILYHGMINI